MPNVKQERTGWRDLSLSERHRKWGWDCPAVDLDFLFLEYDKGQPVAIIEYKHERARAQHSVHPTYQAIINLGTNAGIPVFAVRYSDDFSEWNVVPLNALARERQAERITMSERDFVAFLYRLRGYMPPPEMLDGLTIKI